jgi:hypothetical protein
VKAYHERTKRFGALADDVARRGRLGMEQKGHLRPPRLGGHVDPTCHTIVKQRREIAPAPSGTF